MNFSAMMFNRFIAVKQISDGILDIDLNKTFIT
jgi:hypothetical protein